MKTDGARRNAGGPLLLKVVAYDCACARLRFAVRTPQQRVHQITLAVTGSKPEHVAVVVGSNTPMESLRVTFVGGESGQWSVARMDAIRGASLEPVTRLAIIEGSNENTSSRSGSWILRGVVSHERYVTADEHKALAAQQAPLGRSSSTSAALIPIRKSAEWWGLSQDQRRAIFEERSHHISRSLAYLPRIARRLHHSRDLGEPFDFLTWFEFAPNDESAFDELVRILRGTEEWIYVEREVDLRLTRRHDSRDNEERVLAGAVRKQH